MVYLLHGAGGNEGSWINLGRANFIMDNLLADKKAKPAIIVMPFGQSSSSVYAGRGGRGAGVRGRRWAVLPPDEPAPAAVGHVAAVEFLNPISFRMTSTPTSCR